MVPIRKTLRLQLPFDQVISDLLKIKPEPKGPKRKAKKQKAFDAKGRIR